MDQMSPLHVRVNNLLRTLFTAFQKLDGCLFCLGFRVSLSLEGLHIEHIFLSPTLAIHGIHVLSVALPPHRLGQAGEGLVSSILRLVMYWLLILELRFQFYLSP